jgi:hypothetical protein
VGAPPHRAQALSHHSARHLQRLTGTDLVCGFSDGRMPPDKAELNMRLFAERVMPAMQHDAAFAGPAVVPVRSGKRHDDVFAPV